MSIVVDVAKKCLPIYRQRIFSIWQHPLRQNFFFFWPTPKVGGAVYTPVFTVVYEWKCLVKYLSNLSFHLSFVHFANTCFTLFIFSILFCLLVKGRRCMSKLLVYQRHIVCKSMHQIEPFGGQIWKKSLPWEGGQPPSHTPSPARSLRSLGLGRFAPSQSRNLFRNFLFEMLGGLLLPKTMLWLLITSILPQTLLSAPYYPSPHFPPPPPPRRIYLSLNSPEIWLVTPPVHRLSPATFKLNPPAWA